ncbi:SRPBCC family protein [Cohaesibacter gelatinilyticus]|uniref:Polyketide cyclase / dehydrase and lipid transport n=1 Tax=Cohaesibacter gelatinilyticus TaxID=372072 RepID=A0A285PHF9_9HYPH|nr:SRPBCC family protein [Cohaesibacter gelatinilyticus]SNZ19566.1 Polyketide cyclase / dehydrase and lipid transport [Cohaesibacter gelatinilyticus]
MTIWTILASTIAVVALAAAGTLLLPKQIKVERQATISATPSAILTLAASNEGYQRFNPYLSADPNLKISHFGPSSGIGSGFTFDGKDGKGSQTVAELSSNSVRYAIDLGPMGKPAQTIEVNPVTGGSLVTWSMDMDLGYNPIARIFGLFMDGMVGRTFEQGLDNLATAT